MTLTRIAAITGTSLLTVAAYPSSAQNANFIIVEQDGDQNTLRVDQSRANNSLVAGVPSNADFGLTLDPNNSDQSSFVILGDIQTGPLDTITVVDRETSATQRGVGNSGNVTLEGNGSFAGLEQFGDRNEATINVDGDLAGGIIVQSGNSNKGTVNVAENGAFGELIQIGNENETAFTVSGNPSANVSFTVQGNAITTNIPASVVTSSGGQVTIVQRQLGTFGQ